MTRDEAIAKLKIYRDYLCKMSSMFDVNEVAKPINMAIEALERKRGEWIETSSGDHWKCSRCNYRAGFWFDEENSCEWSMDVSEWLSNFCPNCGADMRERREDESIH